MDGARLRSVFGVTLGVGLVPGLIVVAFALADVTPTAVDDSPTVREDSGANVVRVRQNDMNPDGGPFVVESVSDPANGTAQVIDAGARVSYAPDPDYCNRAPVPNDTFTYTLNGGSTATVSVDVKCADDPPTAVDDELRQDEDVARSLLVRRNDTDVDAGPKRIIAKTDAAHGDVSIDPSGDFLVYSPDTNYCRVGNAPPDTFTYTLNGGSTADVAVTVRCVNDPPTLDLDPGQAGTGSSAGFSEDGPAAGLAPGADLTDIDSGTLTTASITLTNRPDGADESLAVAIPPASPITTSGYDSATGTLALSGRADWVAYEQVLQSVEYSNSDQDPDAATRLVDFQVAIEGRGSNTGTAEVSVTPQNDSPSVDMNGAAAGIDSTASFVEDSSPANPGSGAATLGAGAAVADVDNAILASATLTLTNRPDGAAESLAVTIPGGNPITTTGYDPATGVLELSGPATKAEFAQVLQSARYDNTSNTPNTTDRDVSTTIDDGALDSPVAHTTMSVTATNDAPLADDETFNGANGAIGNTPLAVGSSQAEPRKAISGDVLTGDTDSDGPGALTAGPTGAKAITTADGGRVTMEPDGNFVFFPKAGTSCTDPTDQFDYTVSDGGANGTGTGTVTVAITDCVWYLDNSLASIGDGSGDSPFNSLAPINGAGGVGDSDAAGHRLLILGDGAYTGGLPLENNQTLSSERHGLVIGSDTIVTAGGASNPSILSGPGNALTLANSNTIQGIDLGSAGNTSLVGSSFSGTATVNTVTSGSISNTGGKAVDISNGTVDMAFSAVSSTNSPTDGIRLDNAAGTFNATAGSITNATDQDVDLSGNNSGDTVDFTYSGSITDDVGTLVNVSGQSGGTKVFNGAITDGNDGDGSGISVVGNTAGTTTFSATKVLNTGTNAAVTLTSNTGHTINFTGGGLDIDTTSGAGFSAAGGGTVTVQGAGNSIASGSGAALNVTSTTIGAADLTFESINAGTASGTAGNGIVLDTTGASGGLTVTGTGTTAGSGGTIRQKTGADGSSSAGIGIYLNNTRDVSLKNMQLNDFGNFAIDANNVTNFDMDRVVISGSNGTNDAFDEGSITFDGLFGSATISNSSISGGWEDNVNIENVSGTLNRLTVSGTTFGANSTTFGNDALAFTTTSNATATMNLTVTGSTFTSARGDLIHAVARGGTMDVDFTNNTLTNNHANILSGGGGTTFEADNSATNSPNLTFDISGNTMRDALGVAINVFKGPGTGTVAGTINNNTIGVNGIAHSGSAQGSGINFDLDGGGSGTVAITDNTVRRYNGDGIHVTAGSPTSNATLNATVTGNTVEQPDEFGSNAFELNAGTNTGNTNPVCLQLTGNAFENGGSTPNFEDDVNLRQRFLTTVRIPGYTGPSDGSGVAAFLQPLNTGAETYILSKSAAGGGFFNTIPAGSACPQP